MKKFESGWQKRQRKRELEEVGKQQRGSIDKFLAVKTREVALLKSLLEFLTSQRHNFEQYNDQANNFCSKTKDFEEKREFYTADVNNELFNEWIQWRSFLK